MNEETFREEVCHGLNEKQKKRFLEGREKYGNNPKEIDYKKEIAQEYDDIYIYQQMDFVING